MSKKKSKANKAKSTALALAKTRTPEELISQAIAQKVPVDVIERLMAIRREVKAEKAQEAYVEAMSRFQSECPIIKKNQPVFNKDKVTVRYRYAPLDEIVKQVRSFIQKNGFSYTLDADIEVGWVTAICKVTHELGHSETSKFKATIDTEAYMNAPQKYASALTFGKRYAFCNAFGILTGDEDNNAVSYQAQTPARDVDAVDVGAGKKFVKADINKRFAQTKTFIENARDVGVLIGMVDRLEETDFTKEQKKEINALISNKVDSINAKANK